MADPVLTARPFERLSRLNGYQVERHHTDPRGWTVVNAEGKSIGTVKDLIVDTDRMAAAYLDVELDSKLFDLHGDPHVLVPMQRAERVGEHHRLRVDGLSRERVAGLALARDAHQREFWRQWWDEGTARPSAGGADWAPTIGRHASHDDLQRTIDSMQPGDTVRIPVVNEEIVVERRIVGGDAPASVEPRDTPPRKL